MAKKKEAVEAIMLQCETCKKRNYATFKNKKNTAERLELTKYCKYDKKHTPHKEVKK